MSDQKDKSAPAATAAENPAPVDAAQVARDAVAADRARRKEIMESDEAKERQTLAAHLADSTDMSPDEAKAVLAKAATEKAPAASTEAPTPFAEQMDAEEQPAVGAAASGSKKDDDEDSAEGVVALVQGIGLKGFGASKR